MEAYQPLDKVKGGGDVEGGGAPSAAGMEEGLIPGMGGFDILKPIVASHTFQVFSFTFLIINVVLMCLPTADQTEQRGKDLQYMTSLFTGFFMLEILLRLLAAGPSAFFASGGNRLDVFLVGSSTLDVALIWIEHQLGMDAVDGINLNAFRGLRLLRVLRLFRLVQYWKGVYKIFASLIGAGPQIVNIFVLLFVFMTVFALLGMQLFAGACGSDEGNRYHFDYYVPGMLVVLIVFSGGWVDAYESCLPGGVVITRVYFGAALLIGFFIIMNLFVAILLESLAEAEEEIGEAIAEEDGEVAAEEEAAAEEPDDGDVSIGDNGKVHWLRGCSRAIINNPTVEWFLLIAILSSCVTLALDTPDLDRESELAYQLKTANLVFTVVFTIEALLRINSYDVLHPTKGYFTQPLYLLDFVIVMASLISLYPGLDQIVVFRILRVLRPMRLLSRVPGMALIFTFLIDSAGEIFNVVGVVFFCHTLFAVVGMELFSGRFGSCTDPSIKVRELCVPPPEDALPPVVVEAHGSSDGSKSYSYDGEEGEGHRMRSLAEITGTYSNTLYDNPFTRLALGSPPPPPLPHHALPSAAPLEEGDHDEDDEDDDKEEEHSLVSEAMADRRRYEQRKKRSAFLPGRRLKGGGGGGGGATSPSLGSTLHSVPSTISSPR